MAVDPEDKQLFEEAEHIRAMTQSRGWQVVFESFKQHVLDMQNIYNIDNDDPAKILIEIGARKLASDLMWKWIKQDVYGKIEQQEAAQTTQQRVSESHIERHE